MGPTQRAILEALSTAEYKCLTVIELAEALDRSDRQIRTAAHALEERGAVRTWKGYTGWRGRGDYGRLEPRLPGQCPELPTILTRRQNDPYPGKPGRRVWLRPGEGDILEFVYAGVPTYGMYVKLTAQAEAERREYEERFAALFGREASPGD